LTQGCLKNVGTFHQLRLAKNTAGCLCSGWSSKQNKLGMKAGDNMEARLREIEQKQIEGA
jgi:hypothetical protein